MNKKFTFAILVFCCLSLTASGNLFEQVVDTPEATSLASEVSLDPYKKSFAQGCDENCRVLKVDKDLSEQNGLMTIQTVSQLVIFFVILGLFFYGFAKFGKRFGFSGFNKIGAKNDLKILEIKSLGNRQHLAVVAYEEQKFLLSVSPNRVEYLCPLGQGKRPVSDKVLFEKKLKNLS